ncbi:MULTISPECIES: type II toxin-antitoxin system RelE/ParE family toxin [Roseateles]|uniref:Type II toxin-antitoxin system RelE/ParE family toxin n=1 Tax=Pelomonas caseinilytica TaxID=2906763 RepID=A0ABS8XFS5_9BURK|nr:MULTISPECIES: type II toxin-antitoxin system RelE/ParE family toxin [unclassified Roseateles]MCE4538357.1 type II toxin-antitoxin system RelE/ParE family toxin [Pelomonas sp. P7]HEV6964763.1 type II toxin-antitoxin system RelE/ParE family toxin [Roseateles sp.]
MKRKRVFKTKSFDRWAKKVLTDALLCAAAREIEQGVYEADLGQGVCKKRIAVSGKGKSGGTRTLVAKQHAAAIIFLVGREKNEPGPDFSDVVVEAAKTIASDLSKMPIAQLETMATDGKLKEICNAKEKQ